MPDGGERADGERAQGEHAERALRQGPALRAEPGLTAQDWLLRLLPLVLLIVAGLAGLRGAAGTPRWDGPLHQDAAGRRRGARGRDRDPVRDPARAPQPGQPGGDRGQAARGAHVVLGAGAVGAVVLVLFGASPARVRPGTQAAADRTAAHRDPLGLVRPRPGSGPAPHFPVTVLLYALLVAVLLAGVAVSIWWARRLRPPIALRAGEVIAEDPERLREAVESGRSALRTVDDARAAIIACYLAMETSLAERGTARGVADTPGELLTRATEAGLVRGTAAGRLTALFYEARFSSHPLGHAAAGRGRAGPGRAGRGPGGRCEASRERPDERARRSGGGRGHGQPLARDGARARDRGRR